MPEFTIRDIDKIVRLYKYEAANVDEALAAHEKALEHGYDEAPEPASRFTESEVAVIPSAAVSPLAVPDNFVFVNDGKYRACPECGTLVQDMVKHYEDEHYGVRCNPRVHDYVVGTLPQRCREIDALLAKLHVPIVVTSSQSVDGQVADTLAQARANRDYQAGRADALAQVRRELETITSEEDWA